MNINVSPPRKGFFVTPNEKIQRLNYQNVDYDLDSCFSSIRLPIHRNFDVSSGDAWKKQEHAEKHKSKKKSKAFTALVGTRVTFRTDENGDILTENIALKFPEGCNDEDILSNWWRKTELNEIKKRAKQVCRPFLTKRPDYRAAIIRTLIRCGAQTTEEISEIEFLLDHTETEDDEDISTIVDGMHRGLEKRMILALNLPFHFHKRSIGVVLDIQSRLRDIDPLCFNTDQKTRMIATQYAVNAQYAKEWARKIAQGDSSSVARNFHYDW